MTRRVCLAASAAALLLALSGCSVVSTFTPHVQPTIFDSAKDFTKESTSAFGSPTFVPDDATVIRVDWDSQTGEAIMTYTSTILLAPNSCPEQTDTIKPTIQDSWWPVSGIPARGSSCPGGWVVFAIANQVYAARAATS